MKNKYIFNYHRSVNTNGSSIVQLISTKKRTLEILNWRYKRRRKRTVAQGFINAKIRFLNYFQREIQSTPWKENLNYFDLFEAKR